ncbi:3',5'-cyclic-AMP phosphodiesterase [Pseudomonas sp.]|uniref:3',5'-cyclic-AMP phosphodiesterase n=1 Tax=Pseudomonas sp. TaxID=306 RepID=UPI0028B12B77|nr:3',5'-cyclic-AMP phosphodiesterase [Pseudomonas sp.]
MAQPDPSYIDAPIHVVQLTDPHLFADPAGGLLGVNTRDSLRHVIEQVRREQPRIDLLLCTGDLSQDASQRSYAAFCELTDGLAAVTRWLPGNHDDAAVMAEVGQGAFLQAVTDIGAWRVVMLNSAVVGATHGLLEPAQLDLLEQALASAGQRHCLVCLHHQPIDIGCAWIAPIGLRNADQLFARLHAHPQVRGLLWGHVHQPWDEQRGPLRLLATPSTCIQFAAASEAFQVSEESPGYRWLRLHSDGSIETAVVRADDYVIALDFDSPGY